MFPSTEYGKKDNEYTLVFRGLQLPPRLSCSSHLTWSDLKWCTCIRDKLGLVFAPPTHTFTFLVMQSSLAHQVRAIAFEKPQTGMWESKTVVQSHAVALSSVFMRLVIQQRKKTKHTRKRNDSFLFGCVCVLCFLIEVPHWNSEHVFKPDFSSWCTENTFGGTWENLQRQGSLVLLSWCRVAN